MLQTKDSAQAEIVSQVLAWSHMPRDGSHEILVSRHTPTFEDWPWFALKICSLAIKSWGACTRALRNQVAATKGANATKQTPWGHYLLYVSAPCKTWDVDRLWYFQDSTIVGSRTTAATSAAACCRSLWNCSRQKHCWYQNSGMFVWKISGLAPFAEPSTTAGSFCAPVQGVLRCSSHPLRCQRISFWKMQWSRNLPGLLQDPPWISGMDPARRPVQERKGCQEPKRIFLSNWCFLLIWCFFLGVAQCLYLTHVIVTVWLNYVGSVGSIVDSVGSIVDLNLTQKIIMILSVYVRQLRADPKLLVLLFNL